MVDVLLALLGIWVHQSRSLGLGKKSNAFKQLQVKELNNLDQRYLSSSWLRPASTQRSNNRPHSNIEVKQHWARMGDHLGSSWVQILLLL